MKKLLWTILAFLRFLKQSMFEANLPQYLKLVLHMEYCNDVFEIKKNLQITGDEWAGVTLTVTLLCWQSFWSLQHWQGVDHESFCTFCDCWSVLFENHTDFTFVVLAIPLIFALLSTGGRWVIFFVVGSQFHSEIIQISLNSSLTPSFFPVLATLATGGRWVIILMKLIKISFKQDLLRLKTSCNFIFALLTTLLFCAIESEIRTS